jgi:hypothetical protein
MSLDAANIVAEIQHALAIFANAGLDALAVI